MQVLKKKSDLLKAFSEYLDEIQKIVREKLDGKVGCVETLLPEGVETLEQLNRDDMGDTENCRPEYPDEYGFYNFRMGLWDASIVENAGSKFDVLDYSPSLFVPLAFRQSERYLTRADIGVDVIVKINNEKIVSFHSVTGNCIPVADAVIQCYEAQAIQEKEG